MFFVKKYLIILDLYYLCGVICNNCVDYKTFG